MSPLPGLALLSLALSAGATPAPRPGSPERPAVSSSTVSTPQDLVGAPLRLAPEHLQLSAFPETLIYDVSWGVVGVGEATMEVNDLVEFNGRPAYHLVSRAVSNKFCDGFYKVRDLNESWLDAKTFNSLGYSKKLREGGFFRDEWVVYVPEERRWLGKRTNRDGHFDYAAGTIPVSVQDVLSSMFYIRNRELVPGSEIVLDVNTRQNWPLIVRVHKKEKIKTPAGKFNAYRIEPALRQEGIFIQKGKKLTIWVTDDPKHVPVMMKVEVFFGHITAKLVKMVYSKP